MSDYKNPLYRYIDDYNYLAIPISDAIVGFSLGGLYGAGFGFGVGALDELLKSYDYTSSRYLSAMLLGAGVMTSYKKPQIITNANIYNAESAVLASVINAVTVMSHKITTSAMAATGAIFGLGLATGTLQNYPVIIKSAENALVAGQIFGPYGTAGGVACTILDTGLKNYNITDIAYCSSVLKGIAFAHYVVPKLTDISGLLLSYLGKIPRLASLGNTIVSSAKALPVYAFIASHQQALWSISAGSYAVYNAQKSEDMLSPITRLSSSLQATYSSVINASDVREIVEKQALTSISLDLVTQRANMELISGIQSFRAIMEQIKMVDFNPYPVFYRDLRKFFWHLPFYVLSSSTQSYLSGYYTYSLGVKIEKEMDKIVYSNETILKLQQNKEFSDPDALLDRMNEDISTIVSGLTIINSAVSTHTKALITSVTIINNNAFDIIICSIAYSSMAKQVTHYLSSQFSQLTELVTDLESKHAKLKKSTLRQSKEITLSGGMSYVHDEVSGVSSKIRENYVTQQNYNSILSLWRTAKMWIDDIVSFYMTFDKLVKRELDHSMSLQVMWGMSDVSAMIDWSANNAGSIASIYLAIRKFNELFAAIKYEPDVRANVIKYHHEDLPAFLTLDQIELKIQNKILLNIDHLEFEHGKIYALTGKSGCGKTSLLIKIKGLEYDGITATGHVNYPENAKIVFTTQNDYIPLESTLYEVIMYPMPKTKAHEAHDSVINKITELMVALEIDQYAANHDFASGLIAGLNNKADWVVTLSGGQKKKIAVIRSIMQDPDLLMLDEVLTGLDSKSTILTQQALKSQLSNATIIVVDHHAHDNNAGHFYDEIINIVGTAEREALSLGSTNTTAIDTAGDLQPQISEIYA